MSATNRPPAEQRAQNRGTAAGLFALAVFTLVWVAGWQVVTGDVPISAVVWWLAAWGTLALLGYPRSTP